MQPEWFLGWPGAFLKGSGIQFGPRKVLLLMSARTGEIESDMNRHWSQNKAENSWQIVSVFTQLFQGLPKLGPLACSGVSAPNGSGFTDVEFPNWAMCCGLQDLSSCVVTVPGTSHVLPVSGAPAPGALSFFWGISKEGTREGQNGASYLVHRWWSEILVSFICKSLKDQ